MRLIVLAVFLAVMQAAPPVPRKAPDNSAGTPQTRQNNSASNKAPSQAPTPTVHLTSSNGNKEKSDNEGSKNTGNTVRITELPPVSVAPNKRDWVDWGYWGFNGLLVIVGGFQVWLLYRTLRAIKRQADIYDEQRKIMEGQLGTMQGQLAEMNRQVDLQKTGMSQWVTFQGWRHKVKKNSEGDLVLEFNFDIVNPTNWPMHLVSTILKIRNRELMSNHFVPLLPKEPYAVGMSQIVMGGKDYIEGGMTGFVLFGVIVYVDCFRNQQSQIFSGYLSCIEGGETHFNPEHFPDNPYMKYQEEKGANQSSPPSPAKSRDIPPN